jgi:Atypical PilZ domain, cyclic di-GMP receptor
MVENSQDSLGSGLVLEEYLPVACVVQNSPLDPQRIVSLQNANERVLNTVIAVEDSHADVSEEYAGMANELQRMEFKINLVLDLVSQVLTHHLPLPPRAAVRLGADRIEWGTKTALSVGQALIIEVYLNSRFPRPVMLPARVESVEARPQGAWVVARFEQLGDTVTDVLEKMIFRSHRRRVASRRQRGGAGS